MCFVLFSKEIVPKIWQTNKRRWQKRLWRESHPRLFWCKLSRHFHHWSSNGSNCQIKVALNSFCSLLLELLFVGVGTILHFDKSTKTVCPQWQICLFWNYKQTEVTSIQVCQRLVKQITRHKSNMILPRGFQACTNLTWACPEMEEQVFLPHATCPPINAVLDLKKASLRSTDARWIIDTYPVFGCWTAPDCNLLFLWFRKQDEPQKRTFPWNADFCKSKWFHTWASGPTRFLFWFTIFTWNKVPRSWNDFWRKAMFRCMKMWEIVKLVKQITFWSALLEISLKQVIHLIL